jgi:hypothetical protein
MERILSDIEFTIFLVEAGATFLWIGASLMAFLICMDEQGRH